MGRRGGEDPHRAVESALKLCEERNNSACTLCAVNNVALNGHDWNAAAPRALPPIGRLRPEPCWENNGLPPQA